MQLIFLSLFLVLVGIAIVRVGLQGQFLGRLKLVSQARVYPEKPQRKHRVITISLGAIAILIGMTLGMAWAYLKLTH